MNPRACALILNDQNNLLLIRRVKNEREYWVFPGGSVEAGESYEQAVVREVREETSLIVSGPTLMLENTNAGRSEFYFKFSDISGTVKLGVGPELERLSATNLYEPIWLLQSEFLTQNVLPINIKSDVLALWKSGLL